MIGYVDLDVPEESSDRGVEFRPATVRASRGDPSVSPSDRRQYTNPEPTETPDLLNKELAMYRPARLASLMASLAIAVLVGGLPNPAPGDESQGREIPTAFSPFEYLVGRWNGQGVPKDHAAQRFRGWSESHAWAWVFTNGKPTGLSVAIEGGKVLAAGKLTYDSARERYRLDGTESKPLGSPIAFEGALDSSGKMLVLDQIGSEPTRPSNAGAAAVVAAE